MEIKADNTGTLQKELSKLKALKLVCDVSHQREVASLRKKVVELEFDCSKATIELSVYSFLIPSISIALTLTI